ncbi:MAG: sodium/solute symporter [Candidatus Latescibacteria bacterium]|nr:sodium/solute symporter [Candidatus Latescibacterota bacterium]
MEPGYLLPIEWAMMVCFVVGVLSWGIYMKGKIVDLSDSFLAGRKVPGVIASMSAIATNFNTNDFIGGVGAAYAMGFVMVHSNLLSCFILVFLSLFFLRKIRVLNVFTLGEWLRKRYSPAVGNIYSIIWTFIWMLVNLGLYIYSGALVLHTLVGWNLYISIVLLTIIAATYTLLGGFGAVVATDVLQMVLMFFPYLFLVPRIWIAAGGISGITSGTTHHMTDLWTSQSPFGNIGIVLSGAFLLSLSYWSSEAQMIQRPLSAKSVNDSAVSYLGVGFWHALVSPLIIVIPGVAALKLYPGLSNNDFAMPMLISDLIPRGLYGVTIVGLMAGFLSSADSQINAFCTMFTKDIYQNIIARDKSTEHYLAVSKISGVIFTAAAIATAIAFSFAKHGMMLMALSILATIMPPSAAVILLGALWKRAGKTGALWGLISGFSVGLILVILDLFGYLSGIAENTMYFRTIITFLTTAIITVVISLIKHETIPDLAIEESYDEKPARLIESPKFLAVMLLIACVLMYTFLTFAF